MDGDRAGAGTARRSPLTLAFVALAGVILTAVFAGLGVWQVERLGWKLDLIERVDARVHAAPVAAPLPADWAQIAAETHEYLRVEARGRFLHDRETLVQAVTEQGPGFWVLTPLEGEVATVIVNRGFVPSERTDQAARADALPEGPVSVTGLLRMTEPEGGFLRANDPASDRWFSRDVAQIAQARGLSDVAPYFVDAEADQTGGAYPVAGLTVIAFRNNHLIYALTWFALAAMVAAATIFVFWDDRRRIAGAAASTPDAVRR